MARFESDDLVNLITRHTLEDAAKDAGALPLLSYTLDDMWTAMVRRGDGLLRLTAVGFEHGGVLADRADAFLAEHPNAEEALKRVLTLRLATVRADGEPTRRRAFRSEFTDDEWQLISELASEPYRLLITAAPEGGEFYAEVAHEAILRRWNKLSNWIADQREFLLWRNRFDFDRREWEAASTDLKLDALLQGRSLTQAQQWLETRLEAFSHVDRVFIDLSVKRVFLIWKINFDSRSQDWSHFNERQSQLDSYDLDYSTNELKPLNRLLVENLLLTENELTEAKNWLQCMRVTSRRTSANSSSGAGRGSALVGENCFFLSFAPGCL